MIGLRRTALAFLLLLAGGAASRAQEVEAAAAPEAGGARAGIGRFRPPPKGTSDTYIVTLSGNGVLVPSFPGSDNLTPTFYPSLNYRRSDEPERFSAPDDGISISVIDDPSFRIGPVFRFQSGRYLEDDKLLFGLRKRNFDVESGLFIEYWPLTFIRARAELRHGFREDSGFVGNIGIDYVESVGRFTFSIGPRLALSDGEYANRYFGVSVAEALASGRVFPFKADGGLNSVGILGAVTYRWSDTWATTGYVGYDRLVRDVAASPIVTRIGSPNQLTLGAKLSYSFSFTPSRGVIDGLGSR